MCAPTTHTCIYTYWYTYTHGHISTHTHTHTHTHTRMNTFVDALTHLLTQGKYRIQVKDVLAPFQLLMVLSFGMARMFMLTKQYQSNKVHGTNCHVQLNVAPFQL